MSLPQAVQVSAPAAEKVPFGQVDTGLLPSHFEPAGQVLHVLRVRASPPLVKEPRSHVVHALGWPSCEYLLSAPQFVQASAPAAENVPFTQVVTVLVPSHLLPAAQTVHVSRVPKDAPAV